MEIQGCTSLAFLGTRLTRALFHEPSCEQGDQSEWNYHEEDIVMEKVAKHYLGTRGIMGFLNWFPFIEWEESIRGFP